jgi:plastocyanin
MRTSSWWSLRRQFRRAGHAARWVAVMLAPACGSPADPAVSRAPLTVIAIDESNRQHGIAGAPLASFLRIRVTRQGDPVEGVEVTWTATSGVLTPLDARTDARGYAQARWTLGTHLGEVTATARVASAPDAPAEFTATVFEALDMVRVPETDGQRSEVDTPLPRRLRVQVTHDGIPRAGVPVSWGAQLGTITTTSFTDANGVADAEWRMPQRADTYLARAALADAVYRPVTFTATALPSAIVQLSPVAGDQQTLPLNASTSEALMVGVYDRFMNAIPGATVQWAVDSGPVLLLDADARTDMYGVSRARVVPRGAVGVASLRASVGTLSRTFSVTTVQAVYRVTLNTNLMRFVSEQNRSGPAVDTIPVGATMTWRLAPFDYDQHNVEGLSVPTTPADGEFPYASPSEVKATFPVPGTYRYTDRYYGISGVIVVR